MLGWSEHCLCGKGFSKSANKSHMLSKGTRKFHMLDCSEHCLYGKGFSKSANKSHTLSKGTRKSHMLGCSEHCLYGKGFSKSANKYHMLSNGARKSHMLGCSEYACIGKDSLTAQANPTCWVAVNMSLLKRILKGFTQIQHIGLQWSCLYWKGFSKGARKSNILGCSERAFIEKDSQRVHANPTYWVAVIMSVLKRILNWSTQIPPPWVAVIMSLWKRILKGSTQIPHTGLQWLYTCMHACMNKQGFRKG